MRRSPLTSIPTILATAPARSMPPSSPISVPDAGPATTDSSCGTRSEEHTSELQSLMRISYAVFCLKKKKHITTEILETKSLHHYLTLIINPLPKSSLTTAPLIQHRI